MSIFDFVQTYDVRIKYLPETNNIIISNNINIIITDMIVQKKLLTGNCAKGQNLSPESQKWPKWKESKIPWEF